MADPRVLGLLEEMLDARKTPEEVCRDCPELLAEVQERWREFRRFDAAVVELLPELEMTAPAGAVTPVSFATSSLQVPRYQLTGEIGRGGMGVAYKAHDLSLDRDVAIKLLQDGYKADSSIARRFADEARITAQLQHPGIPPVHELGTLADGRPFLAMKLIKGSTLDQLLAARANPSDGRARFVATFEQICQAVGYAHAHHVIHRDLKPSNVMVGAFSEVQVMDWGLAKVLTARDSLPGVPDTAVETDAATAIRLTGKIYQETQAGSLLGTPAFMPPEQAIEPAIDRIDVRSDVFSLGGILCAILTGRPPFVAETVEATRQLAARARLDDAHARLAACGAEPELVALCRRCLAPEPDGRPRDAGEVAGAVASLRAAAEERARVAELDRVRVSEQGKRRRVLLAASAAVVAVLLAGLSVSLWQTLRAVRALTAEQQAREDEATARQQAFNALKSVTDQVVERKFAQGVTLTKDDRAFLQGIIAQFDAFAAIKGDDPDSRATRAEGRYRVGTIRYRLGELREALESYDQSLNIYKQLAADFPSRSDFRHDLARSHSNRGLLLIHTRRLEEAEQDYDQALSIHKQLAADFPSRPEFRRSLAIGCNNRGNLLFAAGRPEEAERDHDQALSIHKQLAADFPSQPEYREELATSHNNWGALLCDTGRFNDAEKHFDQAVSIFKQLADDFPSRPDFRDHLAGSHNNQGRLLYTTGRLPEAEKDYDQAVSIFKQLAADFPSRPEFRHNLARSYIGRGSLLSSAGRLEASEQDYDQAMSFLKQLLADVPTRPGIRQDLATSHSNRANLLGNTGRLPAAERDYDQALSIQRQLAADYPNHPDQRNDLAGTCVNLAILHQQQGSWAAAKRLLLEGRPHHLAALKANPQHPIYRLFYRNQLGLLTGAHAGLLEREDAVRTAATCRDVGWDAAADAYCAASFLSLCIPIVAKHEGLDATQRQEAATFYGDVAMQLLRDAVNKGYQDVAHLKKDTDLDSLRQRDDFRTLVAELEGNGK